MPAYNYGAPYALPYYSPIQPNGTNGGASQPLTGYTPVTQSSYQPQSSYQAPQSFPQPSNGIVWVQGKSGANEYPVAAGNSILLMDNTCNKFYVKTTDPTGIHKTVQEFEYKEVKDIQNESESPQRVDTIKQDLTGYATKDDLNRLEKEFKDVKELLEELFDSKKDGGRNGK